MTSTNGDINLDIEGDARVGVITAINGTVTVDAAGFIQDRVADALATSTDIEAMKAVLIANSGIGSTANPFETKLKNLEAFVKAGGIFLDNTGDLIIGEIDNRVNLLARAEITGPFVSAEPIGVYATTTIDVSVASDLTITETVVNLTGPVLLDASESILDDVDANAKDIIATEAVLTAGAGVGVTGNALETTLLRLEGDGGSGGFFVDDMGGLVIGSVVALQNGQATTGIRADKDIRVSTTGFLTVKEDVTSKDENITLESIDSVKLDDPATLFDADPSTNDDVNIIPQTSLVVENVDPATAGIGNTSQNVEIFHTANDGSDVNDEDFKLIDGAKVEAGKKVNILGGDDILIDTGTTVKGGTAIDIHGDHDRSPTLNVDTDGARIDILGNLESPDTVITGEQQKDVIYIAPQSLKGNTTVKGDDDGSVGGDDIIIVDQLPSFTTELSQNGTRDVLTLDGRGGNDEYTIFTTNDETRDYIVTVKDTGARNDGADKLFIQGTDQKDVFLSRANFVAQLHSDPTTAGVERINYDDTINGRVRIDGLAGDDEFYSDDNSALMTIDGGSGKDFFQIGQVFGLDRIADTPTTPTAPVDERTGIVAGDEISTVETTLGFLSRGISFPTTILGGDDADRFVVYSNKALIKLFGEDGNDEFVVRAFVLADGGTSLTDTEISGGDGEDSFEYNINAPVSIDGGAGADTVVIIGTEKPDNFVITEDGVQGGGLNVDFTAVERLEVDGLEGDDHFFILSTDPNLVTTIIGGLGSDTIDVGGDVSAEIIALSVEGRSGIVNHAVSSDDPAYNGVFAEGLQLNVADADTGAVIITESGDTAVTENDNNGTIDSDEEDSYNIKLSIPAPATATLLYITVSAALAGFKEDQLAGKTVEFAVSDGAGGFTDFSAAQVLTFDSSKAGVDPLAWDRDVEVKVRGVFDNAKEGEQTIVISHSSYAEDIAGGTKIDEFSNLNINNVEVRLFDNDKAGLIINQVDSVNNAVSDTQTLVFEGDAVGDFYNVSLTKDPGGLVTVNLNGDFSQVTLDDATNPGATTRLNVVDAGLATEHYTLTFDSSNWFTPFLVNVTAVDDGIVENKIRAVLSHSVDASSAGEFATVEESSEIRVDVRDNDSAGIIVKQTNGSTLVSQVGGDEYSIELTKEPTADVQVQILTDGQTLVDEVAAALDVDGRFSVIEGIPTITFTILNWDTPFIVPLVINPNADSDEGTQPIQKFPSQPHLLNEIRGPIIVEGSFIPTKDRSLTDVLVLPTERDGDRPILDIQVKEELQNDVLNVFADGSLTNDKGELRGFDTSDSLIQGGLEFIYEIPPGSLDPTVGTLGFDITDFGNINGLDMGGDLQIDFGEIGDPNIKNFHGGITYHGLETVEIMLGQGNDHFEVKTTIDESVTVIHGGGNSPIQHSSDLSFASGNEISRLSGNWIEEGFVEGQRVEVMEVNAATGLAANNGTFEIISLTNTVLTLGAVGTLTNPGFSPGTNAAFIVKAVDEFGAEIIGGDHITVSGGGGDTAPLIIFGDTTQNGTRYNFADLSMDNPAGTNLTFTHNAAAPDTILRDIGSWRDDGFEVGHVIDIDSDTSENNDKYLIQEISADGKTLILADNEVLETEAAQIVRGASSVSNGNARSFDHHGADVIDARGAGGGVTIFGGQRDDIIFGSEFGDQIAGGSGDDTIRGEGGRDHIYGDSGFNIDLSQRLSVATANGDQILRVVTESDPLDVPATSDSLLAGNDTINGNGGDDIIVGDHAVIEQVANTQRLTNVGFVNKVFSNQVDNAGEDTIFGDDGNDLLIGGGEMDTIQGNLGLDLVFGDNGSVEFDENAPLPVPLSLVSPAVQFEFVKIETISKSVGGDDDIQGNDNNDIILGGFGKDVIRGDEGNDTIFGDNGELLYASGLVTRIVSTDEDNATGDNDTIHGFNAPDIECGDDSIMDDDIIIAGVGQDNVTANLGDDIIIGDNGEIDFNVVDGDADPLTIDLIQSTDIELGDMDTINAGHGDDIAIGGHGGDTIDGEVGSDLIFGDNGKIDLFDGEVIFAVTTDIETATGGQDTITGDDDTVICPDPHTSNDIIFGGVDNDMIDAARGDDIAFGDNGEVFVNGGLGSSSTSHSPVRTLDPNLGGVDDIEGGSGNDKLLGGAQGDTINDTAGDNIIFGDHGQIIGTTVETTDLQGGNDTITTQGGNDIIFGGAADDSITTTGGNNVIAGDFGINVPGQFNSTDPGSGGTDTIQSGDGNDLILGGAAGDSINTTGGDNIIGGDFGVIVPNQFTSTDAGTGGADTITAGGGNDKIAGGAAGDTINAGNGQNEVLGDSGVISGRNVTSSNIGTGGADNIITGSGGDNIIGGAAGDNINSGGGNDNVLGDDGSIIGNTVRSIAPGSGGGDTINALGGNNNIVGGAAGDTINTGGGQDNILGDGGTIIGNVVTSVAGPGGNDNVNSGGGNDNVAGGNGGDNLNTGGGNDNILGDNGVIAGGTVTSASPNSGGNDNINAGAGNDNVIAGFGADSADGGSGDDKILGDNGIINGTVRTTSPSIGGNDDLEGGAGNDIVFGGAGSDRVSGGAGNDRLLGDNGFSNGGNTLDTSDPLIGGNDVILGGAGDDWGLGGFGNDNLNGGAGFDVLLGDNGTIMPFGNGSFIAFTKNPLIGGNDILDGGPGNDILIGGFGADLFFGNLGEDVIIGDNGAVIFTLDGLVLLVDAFGTDPTDRFVLFNLFGRDLEDNESALAKTSDIFGAPLADAYALQDVRFNNGHQFMHHHGELEQPVDVEDDQDTQPAADINNQTEPVEQSSIPVIDLERAIEVAEPVHPIAVSDDEVATVDEAKLDNSDISEIAGSAVILSLAGWRRKKALAQKSCDSENNNSYRIYVDQSQMASEFGYNKNSMAQSESDTNTSARMVFDIKSGRLSKKQATG